MSTVKAGNRKAFNIVIYSILPILKCYWRILRT